MTREMEKRVERTGIQHLEMADNLERGAVSPEQVGSGVRRSRLKRTVTNWF